MEEKARDELRRDLDAFAEQKVGAINSEIRLNNGMTIRLKNWVRKEDYLEIDIILPRRAKSPHKGQSLSNLGEHFAGFVQELNELLRDFGYEEVENFHYDGIRDENPTTSQRYRFSAQIPNPVY